MGEAAFELLEELTEYVLLSLRTRAQQDEHKLPANAIYVRITRIRAALDRARHEQKGGPS